ncbi:hypothetical protein Hanom_Chr00s044822g01776171 [Helianthus anomalus]
MPAIFEEDVSLENINVEGDEEDNDEDNDDEEDDKKEKVDDPDDDVIFVISHSSDGNDDDDDLGVTVTEASNEKNHVDDQNIDQVEKLILRIEPHAEEGEIRHTYTLNEVLKMFNVNEDEFKFDFEEELNAFDINHQPEYEYKYVEDVGSCSDLNESFGRAQIRFRGGNKETDVNTT